MLIYGKLAPGLNIYFFWESSYVGYIMLVGALGAVLLVEALIRVGLFKAYYRSGWRTAIHILFAILVVVVNFVFAFSDSLYASKQWLKENEAIINEVGEVQAFGWFVSGSAASGSGSSGSYDVGSYDIIVKGTGKYKKVHVRASKVNDEPWEIEIVE